MEDLFPALIFLIAGIASAISKAKKNQEKKNALERHKAAAAVRAQAAQAKTTAAAAAPVKPVSAPHPYADDIPAQVIAPTVHTHVQPDCETHDAPGSLNFASTEGKDPCHEEQLSHARTADAAPSQEENGLTFDWSGDSLVKTFVMQEVLTRPADRAMACQRRAR